ncbi:Cathepsin L [Spironucleus salmonicida]|uniref:Cathepsin L n=1 Tax=Spironucleus salmonicida TaxID=348837 RepID=V6LHN3_9EUKA|nr:Cathepsin L [Spironucleus salmonicida]|eukprot:EST43196.1 Papain family cysteine protease [Spironucleus salmonicida]
MIVILAFMPKSQDCIVAYTEFTNHFNKQYSSEKQQTFCVNFAQFLKIKPICELCEVTEIFDISEEFLTGHQPLQHVPSAKASSTCQQVYCSAPDPLPALKSLPQQVDLRELGLITKAKNQLQCGSCWSFGTIALLENSILRDQKKLTQTTFKKNALTLDLSEQFVLSNTYGFSKYCEGGDTVSALNFQIENPKIWKTVETTANYPYNQIKNKIYHTQNTYFNPKLAQEQYLLPYKEHYRSNLTDVIGTLKTPAVSLLKGSKQMDIQKVQMYLARGLAVITSINTKVSSQSSSILTSYAGNYALQGFKCSGKSDHQVLIVGYGTFKGVKVWVIKNSWGSGWGSEGHMYVERGTNQFCMEQYAYAVIPKQYNPNDGIFTEKFPSAYSLKRGTTGLDKDDGSFINLKQPKGWQYYARIISIVLAVLGAIAGSISSIVIIRRKRQGSSRAGAYNV